MGRLAVPSLLHSASLGFSPRQPQHKRHGRGCHPVPCPLWVHPLVREPLLGGGRTAGSWHRTRNRVAVLCAAVSACLCSRPHASQFCRWLEFCSQTPTVENSVPYTPVPDCRGSRSLGRVFIHCCPTAGVSSSYGRGSAVRDALG